MKKSRLASLLYSLGVSKSAVFTGLLAQSWVSVGLLAADIVIWLIVASEALN